MTQMIGTKNVLEEPLMKLNDASSAGVAKLTDLKVP